MLTWVSFSLKQVIRSLMKKILLVVTVLIAGYSYFHKQTEPTQFNQTANATESGNSSSDSLLLSAYSNHDSDIQVSGQGVVVRVLADDNEGSRHQKFIIKLASGQTLLVAHNIDIAPRISSIREGDSVQFNGEYEWNEKGGVIHWTHKDPNGSHAAGWLKHQGQTYQ
jgi:hypothetical protein